MTLWTGCRVRVRILGGRAGRSAYWCPTTSLAGAISPAAPLGEADQAPAPWGQAHPGRGARAAQVVARVSRVVWADRAGLAARPVSVHRAVRRGLGALGVVGVRPHGTGVTSGSVGTGTVPMIMAPTGRGCVRVSMTITLAAPARSASRTALSRPPQPRTISASRSPRAPNAAAHALPISLLVPVTTTVRQACVMCHTVRVSLISAGKRPWGPCRGGGLIVGSRTGRHGSSEGGS